MREEWASASIPLKVAFLEVLEAIDSEDSLELLGTAANDESPEVAKMALELFYRKTGQVLSGSRHALTPDFNHQLGHCLWMLDRGNLLAVEGYLESQVFERRGAAARALYEKTFESYEYRDDSDARIRFQPWRQQEFGF